jgi:uncharacterized phage protein gp47/JayE
MPFSRPTLTQIDDRIKADIVANLPGADSLLRRSILWVLATMHAGASHGLYGYSDWIARQILPDTAEAEILARHAAIWGVERTPAEIASGTATATGNDGASIPSGTVLSRLDGVEYVTTAAATIAAGTATLALDASVAGLNGDMASGTALEFVSPLSGVDTAAIAGTVTGGEDTEDDDALRARLLDRIRQPPHGGADFDYVKWAKEVDGVTRAWVSAQELGIGTVTIRFMRDDDDTTATPDSAEVQAVQDYIDAARPVTAAVTVVAPVAVALDMTIQLTPNSAAVQAAVEAEITDLIRREAIPGGTILISHLREAVSIAAGETDHAITSPAADVTHTTGQIAMPGTITWA